MVIECYMGTCNMHSKDEPFCYEEECVITAATNGTNNCPMCGGCTFEVEEDTVICVSPGVCSWTKEVN